MGSIGKKKKRADILDTTPILQPIKLEDISTDKDPCFGKSYDLSTEECKMCGDSELCAIKMAAELGKTRKQLEQENNYKDLDTLYDKKAIFKSLRAYSRKGLKRREMMDRLQAKYEISLQESRALYKEWKSKTAE